MLTGIPNFIDTNSLIINRTGSSGNNGRNRELAAVDPQGDSITLTHWTQDVGSARVMAKEKLTVTYQEQGQEPTEPEQVNEDAAYLLFRAINGAKHADNVDQNCIGYLIADLRKVGGLGGA